MNNLVTDMTNNNLELTEVKADELRQQLRNDPEVQRISNTLDHRDQIQLLELGKEPAIEISRFADQILMNMSLSKVETSGTLLTQLGKIMDQFDQKDFIEEKQGFFKRMFKKSEDFIEKMMKKYQTMGSEIDKVYVEITKYQDEMKRSIKTLDSLYDENLNYYFSLEKYVIAGEIFRDQLVNDILPPLQARVANNDQLATMELQTVQNALEIVEQRIDDLEKARMVALITAPQIRTIQRGNNKLIAKINSAFVTTIPIFKNGIIQAVNAKRQKVVADSMAELDRRTNELLLKNAQNTAAQSVAVAKLAGTSSIKTETLEQTWAIINQGIQETTAIEEQNRREREDSKKRLEELTKNIKETMNK